MLRILNLKKMGNSFKKAINLFLLLLLFKVSGFSQSTPISGTVNSYTPVTAVYSCSIDVTDVSTFGPGNRVVIMQMKGTVIDTSNTPSFGDVISLNDCGNYEFCHISGISGNTIFFTAPLQRSYNAAGTVQLIKVPQYADATVTAPITCPTWDGSTGGVIIIECSGTLTLNDSIEAKGKGFILGDVSPTGYNCPGSFDYFYPSTSYFGAEKGEGISLLNPNKNNGMGKRANGGGGGNNVNAGGGGGANYGAGGNGGNSWEGCPVMDIGGRGGQALPYNNVLNKVFLGGGGGGGQQNNLQATPGTNGGGIIIIRAATISGNGQTINASAFNVLTGGCDGTGGAGAGGTVLLDVNTFTGALNVNVKGGDGAFPTCYAQGASGGGGGGCVWSKTSLPPAVSFNVSKGNRGIHGTGSQDGMPGDTLSGLAITGTPFTMVPLPITVSPDDSICPGLAATLTVSPNGAGYSYVWTPATGLNNASVFNPSASPVLNTTYSVTLIDSNGCQTHDSVSLTVLPKPAAGFSYTAVCHGNTTVFTDSSTNTPGSIASWTWDFGDGSNTDNSQNPSHLYTSAGTLAATLIVSNNFGCADTTTKPVQVFYNPVAGFTHTPVCKGNSMAFTDTSSVDLSTSIVSYLWDFGDGSSTSAIQNPGHLYASAGTYTVTLTVKTSDSCSSTTSSAVTVFDAPQSAFSYNNTCLNSPIILSNNSVDPAMGVIASWSWDFGDGSPPNTNTFSPQHPYANPGNYTVTLISFSSNLGCSDTVNATVTIFALPVADFNYTPECLGDSVPFVNLSTVSGDVITGTTWFFGDAGPPNPEQNPSHLYATCGTFITLLTVTTANGCWDSVSKSVTVHCLPPANAGINDSLCFMENDTLLVTPNGSGYSYSWGSPSAVNFSTIYNPVISPAATATYTVTLTDINGCVATDSVTVFVDQEIVLSKQVNNTSCYDSCNGQITIITNGGNAPYTYSWAGACTGAVCSGLCDGTYSVTVTDAWGCAATTDTSISEPPALLAFINAFTSASCINSCDGTSTITALGGSPGAGYTYSWNTLPAQTTATADSLCVGAYICSVTDANGCLAADTVLISSPTSMTLSTSTTPTDCNDSTGTATVTTSGGTPGYTFSWSTGSDTGQTAIGLAEGTYTVTVTDNNGCTQSQTAVVSTVAGPSVMATASDITIMAGNSTSLFISLNGSYLWSPDNGTLNCDTCQSPVASPLETTSYCVVVTDTNNCVDSGCVTIEVQFPCDLKVPNAFSPNNDGKNDVLMLHGWDKCVSDFSISIFNRWGEKVFESSNPSASWNGNSASNKQLNSSVFVYYISATLISGEKISRQGNITLLE